MLHRGTPAFRLGRGVASTPDAGHFVVAQGEWLGEDGKRIELTGVQRILVKAQDVEMVELMRPKENTDGRSQTAHSAAGTAGTTGDLHGSVE